jgi:hypothetical protein
MPVSNKVNGSHGLLVGEGKAGFALPELNSAIGRDESVAVNKKRAGVSHNPHPKATNVLTPPATTSPNFIRQGVELR